jgi:tetratricopeptide (TPR) repeat protein
VPNHADNQSVLVPPTLSPAQLAAIADPEQLLERARALEPPLRLSERTAALDRLEELLRGPGAPVAPDGRDWRLEALAERAIDATLLDQLDAAAELADQVLREADPACEIAILRAVSARARLLAWTGTDAATRQADVLFLEAIDRCRVFWRAQTIFFQPGDLVRAAALMREALAVLGPDSPRRATVLTFYADVLIALGEWDAVPAALDEAREMAERDRDAKSRSYVAWSRAHLASLSGDALATERQLREVERDAGDWFEMDTGRRRRDAGPRRSHRPGAALSRPRHRT